MGFPQGERKTLDNQLGRLNFYHWKDWLKIGLNYGTLIHQNHRSRHKVNSRGKFLPAAP
ncbi:hypothetical protein CRC_01370 [Cylindrospermopsis raciborskii CS-505]|jgi:hypothetical protein|nr:hypothetical protein CRC_01370 [Cylindrospermopsis raciborskii CS-505]